MERISIDITGPHPTSSAGHKYMLTMVDQFSKWAEAFPIRNQEATTVAKVLMDRVFCYLGTPIQILTDQGKNFESELFGELCRMMDIEKLRTTIYKLSKNGAVKRFHRTLNSMIGKIIQENQRNWHEVLPQVMAAYRASEHSATGFSPNHIMYGRECRAPIDLVLGTMHDNNNTFSYNQFVQQLQEKMMYSYERVRKHLGIAAERRKRTYDMSVKPKQFEIGQRVWYYYPQRYRFKSPKWKKLYTGPHVVTKKLGDLNYVIKSCNGRREILAHVDKLKSVIDFDNSDSDQVRNRGIPEGSHDIETEGQGPVIDVGHDEHTDHDEHQGIRPRRLVTKPGRYRDFVCFRNVRQGWQTERGRGARRAMSVSRPPVPRLCKYCGEHLEGKPAQRRHVREVHQDVLEHNRQLAQTREQLAEQREQLLTCIRTSNVRGMQIRNRVSPARDNIINIETETNGNELINEPGQISFDFPMAPITQPNDKPITEIVKVVPDVPMTVNETKGGRPSLDQRLTNIKKGTEESDLKTMLTPTQEDPANPRRREMKLKKEEMVAVVKAIDDLSRWFPAWNDDALLQALRRRLIYQSWPVEMLKGLLLMKSTTVNRLKREKKARKEAGNQTDALPSQWRIINRVRVQVQEQVVVVREQSQTERYEETLEADPRSDAIQLKEDERTN